MSLRDKLPPEEMAAARQRYAITRAAEVLHNAWIDRCGVTAPTRDHVHVFARALDAAGLLVTPERDAAVAAKALREAAEEVYGDDRAAGPYSHPLSAASWLRERADRIEREAGESDADA